MSSGLSLLRVGDEQAPGLVLWLHGLGADASDFEPMARELCSGDGAGDGNKKWRFVLPNAPLRPVSLNAGMAMRAWYDIVGLSPDAPEDKAGILASMAALEDLVEAELARGVSLQRMVFGGFSQGAAMALQLGLQARFRPAAVVAWSGYLPLPDDLPAAGDDAPSLWLAHGAADEVVLPRWGRASADALSAAGFSVAFDGYPMGHAVCPSQVEDLRARLLAL